jgi:crotonobetainyl-CoA:carnitine CoA-transferase CaiB-like acyl-CoA transferase
VANRDDLVEVIEGLFASSPAEDCLARLAAAGVPAGKVRTIDDVYAWEQTRSQGLLTSVEHPTLGTVELPGSPIRFDDNPFSGGRSTHLAPPTLGQHNEAIRAWLSS